MKLCSRQIRFCHKYFETGHSEDSAIAVGYSKKSAKSRGAVLLHDKKIKEYLGKLYKKELKGFNVTEKRIMKERCAIAFFDPQDVFTEDWDIKRMEALPEHARRAISSITVKKVEYQSGAQTTTKINFWSKPDALDKLAKMYGYDEPDVTNNNIQLNIAYTDTGGVNDGKMA